MINEDQIDIDYNWSLTSSLATKKTSRLGFIYDRSLFKRRKNQMSAYHPRQSCNLKLLESTYTLFTNAQIIKANQDLTILTILKQLKNKFGQKWYLKISKSGQFGHVMVT